jgi:hypothetical protein
MRVWLGLLVATVALVAAGCGGGDSADSTGEPGELAFDLQEANDSNVAGARAVLTYVRSDRTRVLVDGIDNQEPSGGGANPVQLRRGSCSSPGKVVAKLPSLSGSSSTGTVRLGLPQLVAGDYAVVVELEGGSRTIACGDVPDALPD